MTTAPSHCDRLRQLISEKAALDWPGWHASWHACLRTCDATRISYCARTALNDLTSFGAFDS